MKVLWLLAAYGKKTEEVNQTEGNKHTEVMKRKYLKINKYQCYNLAYKIFIL